MVLAEALPVDAAPNGFDDMADNGSSSLSELGDASDDQSEESAPRPTAVDMDEEDSEAETERLEKTPRKLARTATDTSLLSEPLYTRTPSKLAHSRTIEHEESAPPTPSAIADEPMLEAAAAVTDNPLHSLSLVAASEAANLEHVGRKRKRISVAGSPVHEREDVPARKRSVAPKSSALDGLADAAAGRQEQGDADEELENAEEHLSALAQEELELEERQANIAAQTVNEMATVAKHTKPRKGGRRGKRKMDDPSYAYADPFAGAEAPEAEGEGENEEEDSAVADEEATKKKNAIDELAKIEKKFKLFREK
jgi:hypothetical protein